MAKAVAEAKAANGCGEPAPILGRKTAPASSKKSGMKKLTFIDPAKEKNIRSGGNGLAVQLTFRNQSKTKVVVYWINTSGERVQYKEIKPGGQVLQGTYSGHYWLVVYPAGKALGKAYLLPQAEVDAGRQPDASLAYFGTPRLASLTSSIDLRIIFFQMPCNLSGLARSRVFRASSN